MIGWLIIGIIVFLLIMLVALLISSLYEDIREDLNKFLLNKLSKEDYLLYKKYEYPSIIKVFCYKGIK